MSRFFNTGVLKLLLALGILFGIVGLVYYAHSKADEELAQFSKDQAKEKALEAVTVDNYELKEIGDDNTVHWRLTAKQGTMEPTTSGQHGSLPDLSADFLQDS